MKSQQRKLRCLLLLVACSLLGSGECQGQHLRIYTRIYDKTKQSSEPEARTLTLFHAGRVYDLIDSLNEVIIFEPAQDRFIVLNPKLNLKAVVHTNEIQRLMRAARKVMKRRATTLRKKGDATSKATAEMIEFQLDPKLKRSWDAKNNRLTLSSEQLRYDATLAKVPMRQTADAYRQYADWIVQLNFVLYPRVVTPAARRVLNENMAARRAIPVEVELALNTRPRVSVRAEHRVDHSLDREDRRRIQRWNSLLKDKSVRTVTLREYQKTLGLQRVGKR